jgi:hypothetical protein
LANEAVVAGVADALRCDSQNLTPVKHDMHIVQILAFDASFRRVVRWLHWHDQHEISPRSMKLLKLASGM